MTWEAANMGVLPTRTKARINNEWPMQHSKQHILHSQRFNFWIELLDPVQNANLELYNRLGEYNQQPGCQTAQSGWCWSLGGVRERELMLSKLETSFGSTRRQPNFYMSSEMAYWSVVDWREGLFTVSDLDRIYINWFKRGGIYCVLPTSIDRL